MYIAGVIVHCLPKDIERVRRSITSMQGAEIHAVDRGRFVITVEGDDYRETSDMVLELHQIDGVLSATLVYQHGEEDL